jgi:hypothetical protein
VPFAPPGLTVQGYDTPPTAFYLERSQESYRLLNPSEPHSPLLVILDLNKTLLHRKTSMLALRPYLSTFLSYLFSPVLSHKDEQPLRPFSVMVWTTAQPRNAERMCRKMGLLPGAPLKAVWTRDKLNLSKRDYARKTEAVKDLDSVWRDRDLLEAGAEWRWDMGNTVLIDDDSGKAVR